jgi:glycosyltransferase involved in cell wall biosynthesis
MGWGGQEMRILKEMIGMNERGWHTMVACHPESGLFLHALEHNLAVIPVRWSYKKTPSIFRQLRQLIFECNIQLINTHSSVDAWLGGLIARSCSLPVVRTRHLSTPIKGGFNAYCLYGKLADHIVCTSQKAVELIQQHLGAQAKATCVATGVDICKLDRASKEREAARGEMGLHAQDIAISTACVLRSWKGLEEFLEAAVAFADKPHIHFFIFGGGPGLVHYKNLHQSKYPKANVRFMGHRPDIERYLAASDIFCLLSSAHEGISQSTLQAAYLEKPLITTDVGGLTEVCLHEQTGKVVKAKQAEEVAKAMETLINNPERRLEMGKRAHHLVQERFTFSQTLDEMERIFSSVARARKA